MPPFDVSSQAAERRKSAFDEEKREEVTDQGRRPEDLSAEEREELHRAHQGLRNASHALESLVATEPLRGRWKPEPAPPGALDAARDDLLQAYERLARCHLELLGWEPPTAGG